MTDRTDDRPVYAHLTEGQLAIAAFKAAKAIGDSISSYQMTLDYYAELVSLIRKEAEIVDEVAAEELTMPPELRSYREGLEDGHGDASGQAQESWERGYKACRKDGYDEGYIAGRKKGYDLGHEAGYGKGAARASDGWTLHVTGVGRTRRVVHLQEKTT